MRPPCFAPAMPRRWSTRPAQQPSRPASHQSRRTASIGDHQLRQLGVDRALDHGGYGTRFSCLPHVVVRVDGRAFPRKEEVARAHRSRVLAHTHNGDVPRAARPFEEAGRPEDFTHRVQGHKALSHRAPVAPAGGWCPLAGLSALPPEQFR